MDFEKFKKLTEDTKISDKEIKDAFYKFLIDAGTKNMAKTIADSINLLKEKRPEFASELAEEILKQIPSSTVEEHLESIAEKNDMKKN